MRSRLKNNNHLPSTLPEIILQENTNLHNRKKTDTNPYGSNSPESPNSKQQQKDEAFYSRRKSAGSLRGNIRRHSPMGSPELCGPKRSEVIPLEDFFKTEELEKDSENSDSPFKRTTVLRTGITNSSPKNKRGSSKLKKTKKIGRI